MPTIYDRLTEFNKNRLPNMLQLKYQAMSVDVFCFFRGTCHLFYQDLAAAKPLPPSPQVWICGDLHLENFGSFKGDNRQEYFDLNDFDEALLAPATWELVRMLTAIFVECQNLGVKQEQAIITATKFLNTYSAVLKNGKAVAIDPRTASGIVHEFLKTVEKRKQKELLKKRAERQKSGLMLVLDERHFEVEPSLKTELMDFIAEEIKNIKCVVNNYTVSDCAFRLAGTGSIGVKRYMFLLKNQDVKKKYLLLDMKQAMPSSVKPYVKIKQPAWPTEAVRVVDIQHRMQNINPAFFTPVIFKDEPYIVKQLQPSEDKINFQLIKGQYDDIHKVIDDMAKLTASAQLRSSGRQGSAIADDLINYGEDGKWHGALLNYAQQYAGQVKKDYDEFMKGYKKGMYK